MPQNQNPQSYWAALPVKEFIPELMERVRQYYSYLSDTGRLERWQRNYRHFYGQGTSTTASSNRLTSTGDSGEYTTFKINDYRSIVNHAVVLTLQGRPALQCRASNTDVASKQQTQLGNSLLEYQMRQEGIERNEKLATTWAMLYDEAFTLKLWDANKGPVVRVESGQPESTDEEGNVVPGTPERVYRAGKLEHTVFGPYDVVRDVRLRSYKGQQWYCFRVQLQRWDKIAEYPAFADDLLSVNGYDEYVPATYQFIVPFVQASNADYIDGWLFLHEKTSALPNGRMVLVVDDFALMDTGLPYRKLPVGRIAPAEQDQTCFGYSDANDLVAIQELRDAILSIIASNDITFGGQNIAVKKGWGGSRTQLGSAFNLFELENPQTDIVPLSLARTAPELFQFNQYLDGKQGQLLGINPTVRGNPQENLKSGSAMALMDSKAMQYLSGLQESYNQLLESDGQSIIEIMQQYADEPQIITIAGKGNLSYLRQFKFTKDDLNSIIKVQVESVNPLSQTFAGRLEIARDLLQNDKIERPEQYLQVLETGRLEPLYGDDLSALFLIDAENEALQEGRPVTVLITDKDREHIEGHSALLNDPDRRLNDPDLVERVTNHLLEHITSLTKKAQQNPTLLWALKQEMPPMPPPMQGPPPGAPHSAGPQPPPVGAPTAPKPQGKAPQVLASTSQPVQGGAKLPNQPSMPTNPATGQKTPPSPGSGGNPGAA